MEERNRLNQVYREWKKGIATLEINHVLSCCYSALWVWCAAIHVLQSVKGH